MFGVKEMQGILVNTDLGRSQTDGTHRTVISSNDFKFLIKAEIVETL